MASFPAVGILRDRQVLREGERFGGLGSAGQRAMGLVRRHWLLLLFLVAGTVLRIVVTLAYWPALELNGDSYEYLGTASSLRPSAWHVAGYALFLRALSPAGNLGVVTILQHLMGLGLGVALYVLLLRFGVRPWLAALGGLPVLLDGFQLDIEQFVLAETLADVLLVGGFALLLWRRRLTAPFAAGAGVLLAAAAVTRDATLPVVVVVGAYLLLRGRWRPFLFYGGAVAAVLMAYGFWYASVWGHFGLQSSPGYYLYGRVAPFATCDYPLSAKEARLCPSQPVSQRPYDQDYYVYLPGSPLNQPGLGSLSARSELAERFSEQVILHQPLDYLGAVLRDTWHYFSPGRSIAPNGDVMVLRRWNFPGPNLDPYAGIKVNGDLYPINIFFANYGFNGRKVTDRLHPTLMAPLQAYQKIVYTQGPMLLACLVGAIAVSLRLRRSGAQRRQVRWAALLLAVSALALVVTPSATSGFSYRYQLPLLVLLPPAGVLAADLAVDAFGRVQARRRRLKEKARRRRLSAMLDEGERSARTERDLAPVRARVAQWHRTPLLVGKALQVAWRWPRSMAYGFRRGFGFRAVHDPQAGAG
jgi:hypothetical protein